MRIIFFTLVLFMSAYVKADWLNIGETNQSIEYIDPGSITKTQSGNIVFVKLSDLVKPVTLKPNETFRSAIMKHEVSCSERKIRQLTFTTYEEQMGEGKMIHDGTPKSDEWDSTPKDSLNNMLLNVICRSKLTFSDKR